jgi:hypothetical protein
MRIALEEHFLVDDPAHVDRWRTLLPEIPENKVAKTKQSLCGSSSPR